MTPKCSTSPSCAACKYQRRKCSSDCLLAPHFPPNEYKAFQNAHRLFGVSKMVKLLEQLYAIEQREEAMKSIKYESDMREKYPVHGCAGIISQLRQQLQLAMEELQNVNSQLSAYRQHCPNDDQTYSPEYSAQSQLHLGTGNCITQTIDARLNFQHHSAGRGHDYEMPTMIQHFLVNENCADGSDAVRHPDSIDHLTKPVLGLEPIHILGDSSGDIMTSNGSEGNQCQVASSDLTFGIQLKIKKFQDYEDTTFSAMVDNVRSYVETKEACDSSSETSFREIPQLVRTGARGRAKESCSMLQPYQLERRVDYLIQSSHFSSSIVS